MSQDLLNYVGATLSAPESYLGAGGDRWVVVYNNTGGALTNGVVKDLGYLVDTGTVNPAASASNPMIVCVPVAVAANSGDVAIIGVIDNSIQNKDSIADGTYGYMKIQGVIQANVDGTTDVAIGDQLKVVAAATNFVQNAAASSGASAKIVALTSAIALEARTANSVGLQYVHLIGRQSAVA